MTQTIPTETYYCWKDYDTVEGEDRPRLLTPWSDPMEYEYAANGIFDTKEEALQWKDEVAPDEDWVLCVSTLVAMSN